MTAGRYTVRFARSVEDLDQIQRLRFEIFNLELGEGLDSAFQTGRDHDDARPPLPPSADRLRGDRRDRGHLSAADRSRWRSGITVSTRRASSISGRLPREFLAQCGRGRPRLRRPEPPQRPSAQSAVAGAGAVPAAEPQALTCSAAARSLPRTQRWARRRSRSLSAKGHVHPTLLRAAPSRPGLPGRRIPARSQAARCTSRRSSRAISTSGPSVFGPPAIDRQFKTIDFLVALDVAAPGRAQLSLLLPLSRGRAGRGSAWRSSRWGPWPRSRAWAARYAAGAALVAAGRQCGPTRRAPALGAGRDPDARGPDYGRGQPAPGAVLPGVEPSELPGHRGVRRGDAVPGSWPSRRCGTGPWSASWRARWAPSSSTARLKRDAVRVLDDLADALDGGDGVVVFAEATSTAGHTVLPFRPALLEWAARTGHPVHYASIAYRTPASGARRRTWRSAGGAT